MFVATVEPSIEFIPYIYPPLYYYVAWLIAKFAGVGFFSLRLVSALASLASSVLIANFIHKETGDKLSAALGAGLFLATFAHSGAWFDVARVDALYLFLFLLALYLLRFYGSLRGTVAAGAVFALAYLTKQLALLMALPLMGYALWRQRWAGLALAATFFTLSAAATFSLDWIHGGWYRYYVFETLSQHALEYSMLWRFWRDDLAKTLGLSCVAGLAYLFFLWRRNERQRAWFYLAAGLSMVGGSWISRLNFGGYANVLLWGDAYLALVAAQGFHYARITLRSRSGSAQVFREAGLYGLGLIQFFLLVYSPAQQLPTQADRVAGERILRQLTLLPEPVWMPFHPYLGLSSGQPSYAHCMAFVEILWGNGPISNQLRSDIIQAIDQRRFGAIVLDGAWFPPHFQERILAGYRPAGALLETAGVFYPVTGMRTRPEQIYLRKEDQGRIRPQ